MVQRMQDFLGGLFLGLLATGIILLVLHKPTGKPVELHPPPTAAPIRVHIDGAVQAPGVYQLPADSIVLDAVERAGGLTDEADLTGINLVRALEDGQRIQVEHSSPVRWVLAEPTAASAEVTGQSSQRIQVNTASVADLEQLPGIGPVLARSIIEYRDKYGHFADLEDLLNVPGIGSAKLAAIRDLVAIP